LLHALNETKRPRILVIGDVILDHYVKGEVDRISREAPIPVLEVRGEEFKLGGAANVGANLVSMGTQAHLIGVIADDDAGRQFKQIVRSTRGLDFTPVYTTDRPTIIKTRVVAQHQQMLRFDREITDPMPPKVYKELAKVLKAKLAECDFLIISDYAKGALSDDLTREAIKLARARKIPILVDPRGRDYSKYAGATAVTPNRLEAELATGISCATDETIEQACRKLRDDFKLEVGMVTLGPMGVAFIPKGGKYQRIPAQARQVFDVTGAGDTFIATFAAFHGQGVDLAGSARLANMAAGIKVGKFGAAAIQRDELRRAIVAAHEAFDYQSKIVSSKDLKSIVGSIKQSGRRVVFTNGCFDILHAGHVTYLNWCKAQGDVLVLGLNSDASVRRQNKGPDRPVNEESDRARVLAALADIDFVCVFNESTPERLIRAVRPDVLVKGADWEGKDVAGGAFVKCIGGEVKFAPFLPGRSTTGTLAKIRKAGG